MISPTGLPVPRIAATTAPTSVISCTRTSPPKFRLYVETASGQPSIASTVVTPSSPSMPWRNPPAPHARSTAYTSALIGCSFASSRQSPFARACLTPSASAASYAASASIAANQSCNTASAVTAPPSMMREPRSSPALTRRTHHSMSRRSAGDSSTCSSPSPCSFMKSHMPRIHVLVPTSTKQYQLSNPASRWISSKLVLPRWRIAVMRSAACRCRLPLTVIFPSTKV